MSRYFLTASAEEDLIEIWEYIATDNVTAATGYISALRQTIEALAAEPQIGKKRPELAAGLYSFVAKNHVLFYVIRDEGIVIFRILHSARDISDNTLFS